MERTAEWYEVPDAVKHDFWVGKPLFIGVVYEGRRILTTVEVDSAAEAIAWARDSYGLAATESK